MAAVKESVTCCKFGVKIDCFLHRSASPEHAARSLIRLTLELEGLHPHTPFRHQQTPFFYVWLVCFASSTCFSASRRPAGFLLCVELSCAKALLSDDYLRTRPFEGSGRVFHLSNLSGAHRQVQLRTPDPLVILITFCTAGTERKPLCSCGLHFRLLNRARVYAVKITGVWRQR